MLRRNIVLVSSTLIVVLFIIVVGFIELTFIGKGYTKIIKANWEITLPKGYEQIYAKDSGPSFHGDGERYHIFRYKYSERVKQCIDWYSGNSAVLESEAGEVIKSLDIPEEMRPDLTMKYQYYIKREADSSKLYIIFVEELKEVYIIENLF